MRILDRQTSLHTITKGNQENKKFIITIYRGTKQELNATYMYIGAWSSEKNVWMWADKSYVLDKQMVSMVARYRKDRIEQSDVLAGFLSSDWMVMTQIRLFENLSMLENIYNDMIVTTDDTRTRAIRVMCIKNVMFDSTA